MTDLKIKYINTDIVWEIFSKSWELIRVNYALTLGIVAIFIPSIALALVPIAGPVLGGLCGSLITFLFYAAFPIWEKGNPGTFSEISQSLKNNELVAKVVPLYLINLLLSAGPQFIKLDPTSSVGFSLITLPLTVVIGMAIPIVIYNYQTVPFTKAITSAVEAILKNFIAFVVGFFLLSVVMVLTLLACAIPFFLVGFPIALAFNYLWYRCVFEDLELTVKDEGII